MFELKLAEIALKTNSITIKVEFYTETYIFRIQIREIELTRVRTGCK